MTGDLLVVGRQLTSPPSHRSFGSEESCIAFYFTFRHVCVVARAYFLFIFSHLNYLYGGGGCFIYKAGRLPISSTYRKKNGHVSLGVMRGSLAPLVQLLLREN